MPFELGLVSKNREKSSRFIYYLFSSFRALHTHNFVICIVNYRRKNKKRVKNEIGESIYNVGVVMHHSS